MAGDVRRRLRVARALLLLVVVAQALVLATGSVGSGGAEVTASSPPSTTTGAPSSSSSTSPRTSIAVPATAPSASSTTPGSSTSTSVLVRSADGSRDERSASATTTDPAADATTTSASTAPPTTAATSTTTAPPTTTTAPAAPAPTTPPATQPRPATGDTACCAHWTVEPYRGVGAWVDVYDWTLEHTKGRPSVTLDDIDEMARLGVQTLFIQTARTSTEADLAEPDRLRALIDRAHANGMFVVGWYLPTFVDLDRDLRRLTAPLGLPLDGFSVNIESNEVRDPDERSRRAVEVSRRFRTHVPDGVVGTVVLNPFALDELVPDAWPRFPWAELDPYYEVWQPMAYVTYRPSGDPWRRDVEGYTAKSIEYQRRHTGDEPVSVATGIADEMSVDDVAAFTRGALAEDAIGGSIYDWATSTGPMWDAARPLNR